MSLCLLNARVEMGASLPEWGDAPSPTHSLEVFMSHSITLEAEFDRELTEEEIEFLVMNFKGCLRDKREHRVNIRNEYWMKSTRVLSMKGEDESHEHT